MMKQWYSLEMRLSYAFNDSYVSENRKEYWRILIVKESPMWERRGAASKENCIGHNSLETLAEPGKMSTTKTDITVRTEECQGRVLCEIYHHLHKRQRGSRTSRLPLVSKVNIFSQGKVQRIKPTYPMQAPTAELYHQGRVLCFWQFIHVGDCWIFWNVL